MESATLRAAMACPPLSSSRWRATAKRICWYIRHLLPHQASALTYYRAARCYLASIESGERRDHLAGTHALYPNTWSCSGDIQCVRRGESASRRESVVLQRLRFPDRNPPRPSLREAEQSSKASALLRPRHFEVAGRKVS